MLSLILRCADIFFHKNGILVQNDIFSGFFWHFWVAIFCDHSNGKYNPDIHTR